MYKKSKKESPMPRSKKLTQDDLGLDYKSLVQKNHYGNRPVTQVSAQKNQKAKVIVTSISSYKVDDNSKKNDRFGESLSQIVTEKGSALTKPQNSSPPLLQKREKINAEITKSSVSKSRLSY